ncbi:aminopeptidase N [Plantactinospora sp. WMMB334]|uniref:aminopeptidase N n=1 Tax=Plantactinospora sp. WMMB334 TaxID=3404119 RepID=UPI003B928A80
MPSLTRVAAAERAVLLTVESYGIELDLTGPAEHYRSTSTVRFRCATPGAGTFIEVRPVRLRGVRLNGADLDPAALADNQYPLTGLAAENTLVVEAEMAYSNTGEGLHRFVDPADGGTYLYAMSGLDNAQRIFACFDQPDLKAPVALTVTAPEEWIVAGNGRLAAGPVSGRWTFAPTPPLATYVVTLVAGAYAVLRAEHDGIPLGLYCRRSLAGILDRDAEEILTVTRQCLDRLHGLFGVRYPFDRYDQAFVPEFNMGAMENPGLVTFRDDYLYRSAVTEGERELRATVIAHEMSHMWFGNLVTLRWWDDLWLNESFAEYFGTRLTAGATRFDGAWTTFSLRRKALGYAADQRPSTHPVAPTEVVDAAEAVSNLDGISYAKGASVLRQLVAWLGDDAFLAGLRGYFATHRFGNATLADLLAALADSSGRDLTGWAEVWLRRPRPNTLRTAVRLRDDGHYAEVAVVQGAPPVPGAPLPQGAPPDHPVLRPHRIGVGLYDADPPGAGSALTLRERIEVDLDPAVDGGRTVLETLTGRPAARLLLPNDGDLTFAKVRLDPASAAAVPAALPALADPLTRALLWAEALDAVTDGERPVADLLSLVVAALPAEREVVVVQDVLPRTRSLLDRYLEPELRPAALAQVADTCDRLLAAAPPGGSGQLTAVRGLVETSVDAARLTGWLAGKDVPDGLAVDAELRWAVLRRLAVLGVVGEPEIAAEETDDGTASGAEWAATCRAVLPDPVAKERAWRLLVGETGLSNRLLEATATGFWQPEQAELTDSYVERYFTEMPVAASRRTPWVADRVAGLAYPRYAVAARTRELAAALLSRDDLPSGLRRVVVDADDDLRRALAARR